MATKEQLSKNYKRWISNPDNRNARSEYNRQWAKDHKTERQTYQKQWRESHKAERAAYMREYRRKQKAIQTATDDVSATENKENSD